MRARSFSLFPRVFTDQVSGGSALEIACGEISLFFFAVGILYLLLVFFAIQVKVQSYHEHTTYERPSTWIGRVYLLGVRATIENMQISTAVRRRYLCNSNCLQYRPRVGTAGKIVCW